MNHCKFHIVRTRTNSRSSPIGRLILLEQKALSNMSEIDHSPCRCVCLNFDSPHTSHSLSIHNHLHLLALVREEDGDGKEEEEKEDVCMWMCLDLIDAFLSHSRLLIVYRCSTCRKKMKVIASIHAAHSFIVDNRQCQ